MITIADIARAVTNPYTFWRTLSGISIEMCDGRPCYVAGNAAVSFRAEYHGRKMMLKCFTRSNTHLAAIYGTDFHARELCVSDISGRNSMIDCLLSPYIEGISLDEAICRADDSATFRQLAEGFDKLALEIISSPRAHGDLKPENIIVGTDQTMTAIDWDAAFLPSLAGEQALEIGTAAYQHPDRTIEMYDKHIDDYSIAAISTMLHTAAADPATIEYYKTYNEPAAMPHEIINGKTEWLENTLNLLSAKGMAAEYRIAKMLSSTTAYLLDLERVFKYKQTHISFDEESLYLDHEHGLWCCRNEAGWAIAPLFDSGFEPIEGVMLATLGNYKHFVTAGNNIIASFPATTTIKPLKGKRAQIKDERGERIVELAY